MKKTCLAVQVVSHQLLLNSEEQLNLMLIMKKYILPRISYVEGFFFLILFLFYFILFYRNNLINPN